ncbi:MAG: radical SAM protein [Planctomycetes bacterium]|nr:radical SAM protein [Planctomycetota bacterium]
MRFLQSGENQRDIFYSAAGSYPEYSRTIPRNNTQKQNYYYPIAFFGGSFTGIPVDLQEEYLKEAFVFVKTGRVSGIRLSTRPDYINETILVLLKKYGVTTIELGAQSTDSEVLQQSGRGHTPEDIQNASQMVRAYGFELGIQMMIGLPGDNYERSMQTASDIVSFGAQNTRIYPAIIVKGTTLERRYREGKYTPLSLELAVEWTKDLVRIFEKSNVSVIRMGLHPSDELVIGKSLIDGPFHPSFKEIVMTKIWEEIIHAKLKGTTSYNIRISVSDRQMHYAIGYKQANKVQLQARGYTVQFAGNPAFSQYQIDVCDN